jgi:ribosomal protein S12 methylthiotransferase accessory factor YcaO
MIAARVDRIVMINTLLASLPGMSASRLLRFFSWMPGNMGRGATEQQAVVDALGEGILRHFAGRSFEPQSTPEVVPSVTSLPPTGRAH